MMPNLLSALDGKVTIHIGDCREALRAMPAESAHCVVTSPPYFGLRDYGHGGQIGLELTPDEFVAALVTVFQEVRRVLRDDGTLWLNLGDSYGNEKQLLGIPWRVAFALQADGWYLRQDIIWNKPNPMPESVRDRCTKAHEYIFLLSKGPRYYFEAEAIKEPAAGPGKPCGPKNDAMRNDGGRTGIVRGDGETRNRRSVWTVATKPYAEAHFATYPPDLIEPCIRAGSPAGAVVLDPFGGAGTTGLVAARLGRRAILIELNPAFADMARLRIETEWMGATAAARERFLANGEAQIPAGDLFEFCRAAPDRASD